MIDRLKKNIFLPEVGQRMIDRLKKNIFLPEVGFEPTHPKITELKSAALDHSAIQALSNRERERKKIYFLLDPGFEPGLPRPQRGVLTSRLIEHNCFFFVAAGGTGFRSRCLVLAKHALFQLSYTPRECVCVCVCVKKEKK